MFVSSTKTVRIRRSSCALASLRYARVMVASTRFSGGTSARHWLHPLRLFNRTVLELQAGRAPEGRNGNACLENVGSVSSLLSAHVQGLQNNTRPLCKPPHRMRGYMTPKQVDLLFAACEQGETPEQMARDKAILAVLLDTGVRANELCTLTRVCVPREDALAAGPLRQRTVFVWGTGQRFGSEQAWVPHEGATRTIVLSRSIAQ
jgi:integrase